MACFLSQDKTGIQEIINGADTHSDNQKFFNLPDRLTAKKFLFRAIYKGTAWAYAHDPEFMHVSRKEKYWQGVIDAMYEKYYGLAAWHTKIIQEVNATGSLTTLTGRVYDFKRRSKGEYSVNDITNYPVQGTGAEFVAIARCSAFARWKKFYLKDKMLFVNTVHDSIVIDADVKENSKELYDICAMLEDVFSDVPRNFERLFKTAVHVPLAAEVKYAQTWANMEKFNRSSYYG